MSLGGRLLASLEGGKFGHLMGLAPKTDAAAAVLDAGAKSAGAKAEDDDEKEDKDEKKDSKAKADDGGGDDDDDDSSDKKKKDGKKAKASDDEDDDKKKKDDAKAAADPVRAAALAERERWATVLSSPVCAGRVATAAEMLSDTDTDMSAKQILRVLGTVPAATASTPASRSLNARMEGVKVPPVGDSGEGNKADASTAEGLAAQMVGAHHKARGVKAA